LFKEMLQDLDLGDLYFGWPLPSADFDVRDANDGPVPQLRGLTRKLGRFSWDLTGV
jgi:hypothetical protein